MDSSDQVLADLRDAWTAGLGADLAGLYLHGSLVAGDFAADRSDLDILAVLRTDPDENLLARLAGLHAALDARHPTWAGRIEVEYASLPTIVATATGPAMPNRPIARISPGEALHLLPATSHRLLTWSTVHDRGRSLAGPPAETLLPAIDPDRTRAALLDHVRDWPTWVAYMRPPGAQAYAVLTMCRAWQRLRHGKQLSKRQAADAAATTFPAWATLITWARNWWYHHGCDTDPGHPDAVVRFVNEVSTGLLAHERDTEAGPRPAPPPAR